MSTAAARRLAAQALGYDSYRDARVVGDPADLDAIDAYVRGAARRQYEPSAPRPALPARRVGLLAGALADSTFDAGLLVNRPPWARWAAGASPHEHVLLVSVNRRLTPTVARVVSASETTVTVVALSKPADPIVYGRASRRSRPARWIAAGLYDLSAHNRSVDLRRRLAAHGLAVAAPLVPDVLLADLVRLADSHAAARRPVLDAGGRRRQHAAL